ncbi:hypothetical protein ABZZ36_22590 [Actinacidiphila glaucinigra]|uniref:hypothetical protein n=1 Tax=Actinacidiphila glaucinigra TaxID=235986 RepID=UPI0033AEF58D
MRIRRISAAVIATAALAGLGLTGAATATAATHNATATATAPTESLTPGECVDGGGKVVGMTCVGGTGDGQMVD